MQDIIFIFLPIFTVLSMYLEDTSFA